MWRQRAADESVGAGVGKGEEEDEEDEEDEKQKTQKTRDEGDEQIHSLHSGPLGVPHRRGTTRQPRFCRQRRRRCDETARKRSVMKRPGNGRYEMA